MKMFRTFADVQGYAADIVSRSMDLCNAHDVHGIISVSYVAIFCHDSAMYSQLDRLVSQAGNIANVTATGTVYVIPQVSTGNGLLRILKVRAPHESRPERGDADFRLTPEGRLALAARIEDDPGLTLVERDEFTMIELRDDSFEVRAYFSDPPVEQHGALPRALRQFGY